MNNLFQDSVEEYLAAIYVRWFQLLVCVYRNEHICWIGNLPKQIEDVVAVNISNNSKQLQADPAKLPLVSNCFDMVVLCHEHETNAKPDDVVREAARVVVDGGVLVFMNLYGLGKISSLPKKLLLKNYNYYSVLKSLQVLDAENMENIRNINLLYRPILSGKLFNYLGVLEIVNPFLVPWLANVVIGVWQKKKTGEVYDDSSCRLWS